MEVSLTNLPVAHVNDPFVDMGNIYGNKIDETILNWIGKKQLLNVSKKI